MEKIIKCLIYFLLLDLTSFAQTKVHELNVGDTIPDIELNNIINYKSNIARISDFKEKLLILDFWATWCAPCVASFPKLDSLQHKFEKDIQILPVTDEAQDLAYSFLQKMNKLKGISPLSVTNDKILNRMFKHTTIPHYVWIDGNRKVIAITEGSAVTQENIIAYKRKEPLHYTLKKDEITLAGLGSVMFTPILQLKNAQNNQIELKQMPDSSVAVQSILTKYVPGLHSGVSFAGSHGEGYILVRNLGIQGLYRVALLQDKLRGLTITAMITEIEDPVLYKKITAVGLDGSKINSGLETIAWLKENGYCYEIKTPPALAKERFDIMLNELNRYFGAMYGIEGVVEKRPAKYLALVRQSSEAQLSSTGKESTVQVDKYSIKLQNEYIDKLVTNLALPLQEYPQILNETEYTGKVDIQLNCQLSDLAALNKELGKYGLKLVEKEKLLDIAVIRLKNSVGKKNLSLLK